MTVDAQAQHAAAPRSPVSRLLALDWLTGRRIIGGGSVVLALYAALLLVGIFPASGVPGRVDFIAFQAAGRLALGGEATAAYEWLRLHDMQASILGVAPGSQTGFLAWLNPPHFFFAVMPVAWLPYASAWLVWILACSVIFALAIRAIMPGAAPVVAAFCTPSVLITFSVGQNGLLVAALMALTLALLDRRPVLAGVALGLLTIKPQFGLIFPLLLVATGRWRVILTASATAALAALASLMAFGPDPWLAFARALPANSQALLDQAEDGTRQLQSVYALVMLLSGHKAVAWALHGVVAGAVLAVVLRLWMRCPQGPEESRAAAAIAGAFLITPYVYVYDTPSMAIAALFLSRAARRDGWLPLEKLLLIVACVIPGLAVVLGPHPLIGPSAWLIILALAWRRDRHWRAAGGRARGTM